MESFEIDKEKLRKIIEEFFHENVNVRSSIICYTDGEKYLIDIAWYCWIGVYLSELNEFAKKLCSERIIESASKDFWIFDAFHEKNDYGSFGIMIDVSNTWYHSLKPKSKKKIYVELKHEELKHGSAIVVDEEGLGINKEEKRRQIIAEVQLLKEG